MAYEVAVNVADEIEVAGDRTPDPDGDVDLDNDNDNDDDDDADQQAPSPVPEHEVPEPEAPEPEVPEPEAPKPEMPEPAGPGNAQQHEPPLQSHEPQAQGATSQGPVNGHAPSASASVSAPNQESEEQKGHGEFFHPLCLSLHHLLWPPVSSPPVRGQGF